MKAADYTYFEGLTFRNSDIAISAGTQFIAGSKGLTVKKCRFEDVGAGIFTNYSGSSNFYIADNWFIGRDDPNHVIGWDESAAVEPVQRRRGPEVSAGDGVVCRRQGYGPGHVVAYNYVANFHDGIDIETYGNPDGSAAVGRAEVPVEGVSGQAAGLDRLLQQLHDELPRQPVRDRRRHAQRARAAEHDDQLGVTRVLQSAMLGGPAYWIGNIAYHFPGGSTRLTNGSAGVLFYHNTILSETAAQGTSNIALAEQPLSRREHSPAIFSVNTFTSYTSSDYNGFRPNAGAELSFEWNSPRRRDGRLHPQGDHAPRSRRGVRDAAEYSRATDRTRTASSSTTTSS